MMQGEAREDDVEFFTPRSQAGEQVALVQLHRAVKPSQIACGFGERCVGEIVANVSADRTTLQGPRHTTSAAGAEIEKREGPVIIMVGKQLLYVAILFIVMHVVIIQHLIVNRPLMKKIVRSTFL